MTSPHQSVFTGRMLFLMPSQKFLLQSSNLLNLLSLFSIQLAYLWVWLEAPVHRSLRRWRPPAVDCSHRPVVPPPPSRPPDPRSRDQTPRALCNISNVNCNSSRNTGRQAARHRYTDHHNMAATNIHKWKFRLVACSSQKCHTDTWMKSLKMYSTMPN